MIAKVGMIITFGLLGLVELGIVFNSITLVLGIAAIVTAIALAVER